MRFPRFFEPDGGFFHLPGGTFMSQIWGYSPTSKGHGQPSHQADAKQSLSCDKDCTNHGQTQDYLDSNPNVATLYENADDGQPQ